jgi:RecA-family ATPase
MHSNKNVSSVIDISVSSPARAIKLGRKSVLVPMSITEVLANPCPVVPFVLPGIMPGTVGAIAGPGGVGKTMLQLLLSIQCALGLVPLGGLYPAPTRPLKVALISGEETKLAFEVRLHTVFDHLVKDLPLGEREAVRAAYSEEVGRNFRLIPATGVDLTLIRGGKRTLMIDDVLSHIEGRDIVFIETVSRLHDGDENTAAAMTALVGALEYLAQTSGAAVIAGHHTSKGASASEPASRGSSAFIDNIRWLANLFPMPYDLATELGLDDVARKSYLRYEVTKANHIPPSNVQWLRRLSHGILVRVDGPQGMSPSPISRGRSRQPLQGRFATRGFRNKS